MAEYAVLFRLTRRAAAGTWALSGGAASWAAAAYALAFAASDEWHQTFVPGREGCLRDVGIDSLGVLAAQVGLLVSARRGRAGG